MKVIHPKGFIPLQTVTSGWAVLGVFAAVGLGIYAYNKIKAHNQKEYLD